MTDSILNAVPADVLWTDSAGTEHTFPLVTSRMLADFCRWLNRRNGVEPMRLVPNAEMAAAMDSIDGMLWICWRSLRESEPKITEQEVADLLADWQELAKVSGQITTRSDDVEGAEGSDPPESP